MEARTLKALNASIEKWEMNAQAESVTEYLTGSDNCPLCEIFNHYPNDCLGCPVMEKTGKKACDGTPYEGAWAIWFRWKKNPVSREFRNAARAAAREEVLFLKSLLPTAKA